MCHASETNQQVGWVATNACTNFVGWFFWGSYFLPHHPWNANYLTDIDVGLRIHKVYVVHYDIFASLFPIHCSTTYILAFVLLELVARLLWHSGAVRGNAQVRFFESICSYRVSTHAVVRTSVRLAHTAMVYSMGNPLLHKINTVAGKWKTRI